MEQIKQDDFQTEVIDSEKPVLVDFFATWCGPCKRLSPIVEQLANSELKDTYDFVKVDVDQAPQLSSQYGIMSVPTLMIFKAGEIVYKQPGLQSADALRQVLDQHA